MVGRSGGIILLRLGIGNIAQDVADVAVQKHAQVIDGHGAQGFIVAQPVDGGAADPVFIDERIGADAFFLESFPKRCVSDHATSSLLFLLKSIF